MIKKLITPCLILDQDIFENNINKIKKITSERKLIFRPHLKTAKSKEIAKISSKEFGNRAMVSTIEEIEQLQNCGIKDFLYSVAIVPSKFNRIANLLSNKCQITVSVDNAKVANLLVTFCQERKVKIPAVIELDLDGHRSGVRIIDQEKLLEIGSILHEASLLRGVMSHAGESYALSDKLSLQNCAENEAEKTLKAANTLIDQGMNLELVTIGSTPPVISGKNFDGITELRAGVFMFFDLVQAGIGICNKNEIALSVLTSVISVNKEIEALIIDAGWMALSRDRGTSSQAIDYGYGQVCDIDGTIIQDLLVTSAQQEHGIIQMKKGSPNQLPEFVPGDLLRILPNHACATAAAHNKYHVVSKQNKEIKVWNRFGGW